MAKSKLSNNDTNTKEIYYLCIYPERSQYRAVGHYYFDNKEELKKAETKIVEIFNELNKIPPPYSIRNIYLINADAFINNVIAKFIDNSDNSLCWHYDEFKVYYTKDIDFLETQLKNLKKQVEENKELVTINFLKEELHNSENTIKFNLIEIDSLKKQLEQLHIRIDNQNLLIDKLKSN